MEPWLLHDFPADFYGEELRLVVNAYIRPEATFTTLENLVRPRVVRVFTLRRGFQRGQLCRSLPSAEVVVSGGCRWHASIRTLISPEQR